MADRDVEIKVKVDAGGAVQTFDALGNKIAGIDRTAEAAASGGFSSLQAAFITANQAAELAKRGVDLVVGAVGYLFDAIAQGDQVNDLAQGFDELATAAGASADVFLNQLNRATAETVTNIDLMQLANNALVAGLDPEAFINVANAGKHYADVLGIDAKSAIEGLSNAIESGSTKALKQYGIFINATQAQEDYARAIGTTKELLTAEQQVEATRAAAL